LSSHCDDKRLEGRRPLPRRVLAFGSHPGRPSFEGLAALGHLRMTDHYWPV